MAGVLELGIANGLVGAIQWSHAFAYQKLYSFDRWHVRAPYSWKPYKKCVVDTVETLNPTRVVEIGCGLGDIIGRVNSKYAAGFDQDERVLRAARRMHPNVHFAQASLEQLALVTGHGPAKPIDTVIMVNWPHLVPTQALINALQQIQANWKVEYVVMDVIKSDAKGYRYRHKLEDLSVLGTIALIVENIDPVRDLIVLEMRTQGL